jgi:hypothetical protein
MQEPEFLPGLALARGYHEEVVAPILAAAAPGLPYAAALVGNCSDVLGFDTEMSRDHEWGPRLQLFLPDAQAALAPRLADELRRRLPTSYRGYPTNFVPAADEPVARMAAVAAGPVEHRVDINTVRAYCRDQIGFDPLAGVTAADWLATPQQRLLTVTAGDVFRDDVGDLTEARRLLRWYPAEVWLALMARQWGRIAEREAFPGRAASVGDTLGCTVLIAQIVRDLMRLIFLMERRYAPYAKWLGTAFAALDAARAMTPHLDAALAASPWPRREAALGRAYELVATLHNGLGVTAPLEPALRSFHDRPFQVIGAERFADALRSGITDPVALDASRLGAVDQWVAAVEVLESPQLSARVQRAADAARSSRRRGR